MGFPLSFSKSRRAKKPGKGRAARFRALEERALLSAARVTALDFLTFEGSNTKTGAIDPERFDWHEVGCGRPSGGHMSSCRGSRKSYLHDMLGMAAANADAALAQTNADALAAEKTQNAETRDAAIDGADSAYKVTVRNAWNNSYLMNLASGATAKTDDEALAAAANASLESAAATYRAAAFADYGAALDDLDMIDRIAAYQQERVDRGISVPNDAFADLDDPDFEYQVCFAAGTPVLMADGSTKPIETVRPGDLVLASDHLDPESKPVPARVVRFFDNGLKEVVRVRFEGGTELVCTPGHRFYVVEQGWKHASELTLGDACLSADGKRVAFEGRDAIVEPVGVFNLEVEGKHTYFVGRKCILVHNICYLPFDQTGQSENGDSQSYVSALQWEYGFGFYLSDDPNSFTNIAKSLALKDFTDVVGISQFKKYLEKEEEQHLKIVDRTEFEKSNQNGSQGQEISELMSELISVLPITEEQFNKGFLSIIHGLEKLSENDNSSKQSLYQPSSSFSHNLRGLDINPLKSDNMSDFEVTSFSSPLNGIIEDGVRYKLWFFYESDVYTSVLNNNWKEVWESTGVGLERRWEYTEADMSISSGFGVSVLGNGDFLVGSKFEFSPPGFLGWMLNVGVNVNQDGNSNWRFGFGFNH